MIRSHIAKILSGIDQHQTVQTNNFGKLFPNQRNNVANNIHHNDIVEDLEDVPGVVPTISHHVSMVNGNVHAIGNNIGNGHVPNGRPNFRRLLDNTEHI